MYVHYAIPSSGPKKCGGFFPDLISVGVDDISPIEKCMQTLIMLLDKAISASCYCDTGILVYWSNADLGIKLYSFMIAIYRYHISYKSLAPLFVWQI